MNDLLRTQITEKTNGNKLNELINISRNIIENKMKSITNLLLSIKEENEQTITKSKFKIFII
jgi:hypothetical protein